MTDQTSMVLQYDLCNSLPGLETQDYMRREFIVLGSRILTQNLAVFKPFSNVVVHHIPHQYTEGMAKRSTNYPLGLLFKDENKTSDLVDVLHHLQKEYVPKGPDGVSNVLVGGDRLIEGSCRNIQWAFADGATKEDRCEGLIFKFEDWHAIRNLFEIHHQIFYDGASSKDHGTLLANMTKLRNPVHMSGYFMNWVVMGWGTQSCYHERSPAVLQGHYLKCSNAKQGPHAAYNAYKEFVHKDTTALFITAAMEHFGLQDVTEITDGVVPVDVNAGLPQLKRSWLHDKVGQVVDIFVMLTDIPEAASQRQASTERRQRQQFPCRVDGCSNVYTYVKARETHEKKKHNFVAPSPEHATPTNRDHQKEHTEARLGFGFLLLNMQDAVREGDGERLMRLYKVALLFYKAYGHSHYAYSTFLLTLQVNVTLSPCMTQCDMEQILEWYRGKGEKYSS